ncbi:hypothetical protein FGIG_10302 [Fasciola gigantica]|uniref:Uncharacterized protein n=1 Tax=Fasciola gigantica TaxID=46835 RepID=A0A504Y635_FASGI|nr:hypothetical protein FGIG_10302 [Fasciola gigantica]
MIFPTSGSHRVTPSSPSLRTDMTSGSRQITTKSRGTPTATSPGARDGPLHKLQTRSGSKSPRLSSSINALDRQTSMVTSSIDSHRARVGPRQPEKLYTQRAMNSLSMIDGHMPDRSDKEASPSRTGTLPAPRTRHELSTLSRYYETNDALGAYSLMWRSLGEGDLELSLAKPIYPQLNLISMVASKTTPPLPPPCPPSSLCLPPNLTRRGRLGMSPPRATVSDTGYRGNRGSPLHPAAWKPGGQAICALPQNLTQVFPRKRASLSPPARENVQVAKLLNRNRTTI